MKTALPLLLDLVLVVLSPAVARAEVRLPSLFAEHMVLQRDAPITIPGWAAPGEAVEVEFAGQKARATADAAGRWEVRLAPMPASAEGRSLTVTGKSSVTINDVLVGEVWLCSGQSNMEWALGRSNGGAEAVAGAANPNLRLCTVPHNSQMEPRDDAAAKWAISGPDSTKFFSAIGWWFGSKLQKELGVPVGIINNSFGGTTIQSWIPLGALRTGPWPQDKNTDIVLSKADYDRRKATMQPVMDKYLAEKKLALQAHQTAPEFPKGWPGDFRGPGVLWNGMVHPLLKFRIRGVAWYQGENNAYVGAANTYSALLPVLISEWRAGFCQPDLPFLIFQLAPNRKPQTDPNEASGIAVVQEAQLRTARKTSRTALIVTMDLGEPDVHYKNKEPAAARAVNQALSLVYGRQGDFSSPFLKSHDIAGNTMVLRFEHAEGGLVSRDGPPSGFTIAGEDRKFLFANARIDGDSVTVSNPQVSRPVAVRYGWADLPKVNLFNQKGLPMSPFRTDDWPLPKGNQGQ